MYKEARKTITPAVISGKITNYLNAFYRFDSSDKKLDEILSQSDSPVEIKAKDILPHLFNPQGEQ